MNRTLEPQIAASPNSRGVSAAALAALFFLSFLAAARAGDFEALVKVLDPDVVFRADRGPRGDRMPVTGAAEVAETILARGARFAPHARPAIVNGNAGVIVVPGKKPIAVVGFSVAAGRIVEIDLVADPAKLRSI